MMIMKVFSQGKKDMGSSSHSHSSVSSSSYSGSQNKRLARTMKGMNPQQVIEMLEMAAERDEEHALNCFQILQSSDYMKKPRSKSSSNKRTKKTSKLAKAA